MKNLRSATFWTLDRLRGNKIRHHLDDIERMMSSSPLESKQMELCNSILHYATANVPFYKKIQDWTSLQDFPVVDKAIIKQNSQKMLARNISPDDCHQVTTSGSTGTPFQAFQDQAKRSRSNADAIYWGRLAGYEVGSPLYYLKVWSQRNRMSRVGRCARNVIPVEVAAIQDKQVIELLNQMQDTTPRPSVISYSSALETIARLVSSPNYKSKVPPAFPVKSIIGQSEALAPAARVSLQAYFGTPAYARYGLEELGIVGQQVNESDIYQINRSSFVVEVLKEDSDTPAGPGELGRIVVTDLFNRAQPMIRYDTGDLGSFVVDKDGTQNQDFLAEVRGRKADQIFDVEDRPLSTLVMYKIWWKYPDIRQYQIIQTGRGEYLIRLNVDMDFHESESFADDFRQVVGSNASVRIDFTDADLVLASGKRQAIVSKYRPVNTHGGADS